MARLELHIPADHVPWFRENLSGEVCCDIEDEIAPEPVKLKRVDLDEGAALIQRAIGIFEQVGYPGDPVGDGLLTVTLEGAYAAYLVERGLENVGEDLQAATGNFRDGVADPGAMREVGARASWLANERDRLAGIEPSRKVAEAVTV